MGDDEVLLTTQLAKLEAARHAIMAAIERLIVDDRAPAVRFAIVALCGLFADILSIAEGVPEVSDVVSRQLAESGWRLVPVLHH